MRSGADLAAELDPNDFPNTTASATGRLRRRLSVARAAEVIWSMNSPEFYLLLVEQRRWSPEEFERWLADELSD
jgi:prophage antirepressor-like protein